MDLTPLAGQMFKVLVYLIPVVVLILVLKSRWFKGIFGEFIVNAAAKFLLNKDEYKIIKNVTLPAEGGTTQIDHIIVSQYGVFVIETKNMKGWIYGDPDQPMWTQKIFRHSNRFQNPLRQNYKHTKTLQQLLGLNDDQVHSVVVFVGVSRFKTDMPENVTYGLGYIRYIKSFKSKVLSPDQVTRIMDSIEEGRLGPSFKTHRAHARNVQEAVREKQNSIACPRCGSEMVLPRSEKGGDQNGQSGDATDTPGAGAQSTSPEKPDHVKSRYGQPALMSPDLSRLLN